MLTCSDVFFPVGQGLFYAGEISFSGKSTKDWKTSFVFDCGSVTGKKFLRNSVSKFHKRLNSDRLDFIVLSHLHEDHANGLESLLTHNLDVGAVFLPYLNPSQRLVVGLRCLRQQDAYFEFFANPTAYLRERRVGTIVYLHGGGGEDQAEEMGADAPDEPPDNNALDDGIRGMDDAAQPRGDSPQGDPALISDDRVLHKFVTKSLILGKIWEFRFFNYSEKSLPKKGVRIDKVIRKVMKQLGVVDPVQALQKLKVRATRNKMKGHYRVLASDHNDLSVMLWHGPRQPRTLRWIDTWERSVTGQTPYRTRCLVDRGSCNGTLLTGDIRLSLDFAVIQSHFTHKWARTTEAQVPHHGSARSWDQGITKKVPVGSRFVIGFGLKNRFRHPHRPVVIDILRSHECEFVTEHRCLERRIHFHA